ncbi:PiggyBac transposable elementderived protein 3like, partial [Caligus rogercresseyi]
ITSRTKKWHWALYNWFLNVQMVQAWRLYRRVGKLKNVRKRKTSKRDPFFAAKDVMWVFTHNT